MQFYSYTYLLLWSTQEKMSSMFRLSDCISSAIYSHYLTKSVSVLPVPMYTRSLYLNSTLYTESAAVLNMKKESTYFDQLCACCCKHLPLNWMITHFLFYTAASASIIQLSHNLAFNV